MNPMLKDNVRELPHLRDRAGVFADRRDAGAAVAEMLAGELPDDALVLSVPAGGVPVGAEIARRLGLGLDVAVVSKITPPWSTEVGIGAVAFDGTTRLSDHVPGSASLSERQLIEQTKQARAKVNERIKRLGGGKEIANLSDRTALLVDDGLATGGTMRLAAEAVAGAGARRIIIAVPTGHVRAVNSLADAAETLYCANVRFAVPFAVADAYRKWHDVTTDEAARILDDFRRNRQATENTGNTEEAER